MSPVSVHALLVERGEVNESSQGKTEDFYPSGKCTEQGSRDFRFRYQLFFLFPLITAAFICIYTYMNIKLLSPLTSSYIFFSMTSQHWII